MPDDTTTTQTRARLSTVAGDYPLPGVTPDDSCDFVNAGRGGNPGAGAVGSDSIALMYTYFIRRIDGGPFKIGKAKNIQKRLASLQCGSPVELECVAYIEGNREHEIHQLFSHHRLHGEWFGDVWSLFEFIRKNADWTALGL